jgi:hypothetical protein
VEYNSGRSHYRIYENPSSNNTNEVK